MSCTICELYILKWRQWYTDYYYVWRDTVLNVKLVGLTKFSKYFLKENINLTSQAIQSILFIDVLIFIFSEPTTISLKI